MPILNKSLAVLAALAFFLPFVSFSCSTPYLKTTLSVDISGAKLAQCAMKTCTMKDIVGSKLGPLAKNIPDMDIPETGQIESGPGKKDLGLNLVLFAAIAVLIAAITVFLGKRGAELLSGVASVGVIVLLFMFRSKFGDVFGPFLNSPEAQAAGGLGKVVLQFSSGFWAAAVLSAASAILAFKGTLSPQRSLAVGGAGPAGGIIPQPQRGAPPASGEQLAVCSSCGSVNTAGNKFCLSCGETLSKPAAQPAQASTVPATDGSGCPSCGASNPAASKFCLSCGASMSKPASEPAAVSAPTAAPEGTTCPVCGANNPTTSKFCLSCGASLAQTEAQPVKASAAAPDGSCPSCGASNPPSNKFCLSCGGSLMAGVQLFERSEASPSEPAPAPMAAAAAASVTAPVGQPLPATAPSQEPPAQEAPPLAMAAAAIPVFEDEPLPPPITEPPATAVKATAPAQVSQQALDWETPAAAAPAPSSQESCAACGAGINPGQKFCLACGTPVGQAASAMAPAVTAAPVAAAPAPAVEYYQPSAETQIFQTPPKKSSAGPIIIVVIVLAALGAGGWFGWKYFTRPDVTVTTIPQKTHVALGGKTSLEASVSGSTDTDVDWSVQEGSKGGQVAALGAVMSSGQVRAGATYTAPSTPGTFHVIATSHANPSRTAKVEIVVGGTAEPDSSLPTPQPSGPTTAPTTTPAPTAGVASPMAAQIVGTWRGPVPPADMTTTIGADSSISMASPSNPQKNASGTYRFTDNSHLEVDFGNGDVRKWEIVSVDNAYMRVSSQSKDGSSAIVFAKAQ